MASLLQVTPFRVGGCNDSRLHYQRLILSVADRVRLLLAWYHKCPLVVSVPTTGNQERTRNLVRGRNLTGNLRVPCNIVGVNNGACAPSLDLKLSWDGPTSDVDLHVYEENGNGWHMYYGNQQCDYG